MLLWTLSEANPIGVLQEAAVVVVVVLVTGSGGGTGKWDTTGGLVNGVFVVGALNT